MQIKLYQVDAFADKLFAGNPAAVCPLDHWLPDVTLQNIAMENNLSETAFYVNESTGLHIRWFTPALEVDLCGHATLATAFVLFYHEGFHGDTISFQSRSGTLTVSKNKDVLTLNFPADSLTEVEPLPALNKAFHLQPVKTLRGKTDYMLIYENERLIKDLVPDFGVLAKVDARGVIVTAPGDSVDFVSRFFAPQAGVNEDPVTGSAHTSLTPYWANVLGKTEMNAVQCSARGGNLHCTLRDDRVEIGGRAKLFMMGTVFID